MLEPKRPEGLAESGAAHEADHPVAPHEGRGAAPDERPLETLSAEEVEDARTGPEDDSPPSEASMVPVSPTVPRSRSRRGPPLRLFVLLLGLLAALLVYRTTQPVMPEPLFVQRGFSSLPEIERPEGELLAVFEAARPATVQIETRAEALALSTAPQGVGTGFFISPDGLVLTAYHVVDPTGGLPGPDVLEALSPGGARYGLELVGFDAYRDLAVLQADLEAGTEVPSLPLASRALEVGSEVVAIGNSRGEFLQGRVGRVRRLDVRAARADFADGTSELTASLAPGDSGGPVLNREGEVVGVVSYIAVTAQPGFPPGLGEFPGEVPDALPDDALPEGHPDVDRFPFLRLPQRSMTNTFASYAVPVSSDSEVLAGLREGVQRDVPVIGFTIGVQGIGQSYDPRLSPDEILGPRAGVVVGEVAPGGPAERAGLRSATQDEVYSETGTLQALRPVADVIVAVDGERTPTFDALTSVIRRRAIGQTVEVEVQRGGELLTLSLELGARRAVFDR